MMLKLSNIPLSEQVSCDYKIRLNGCECGVYSCRVSAMPFNTWWPGHQRSMDQSELASFISFSSDNKVEAEVECIKDFDDVVIRPLSKRVKFSHEGKTIRFTLEKEGQYVLEPYEEHFALHIFFNKPNEFEEKSSATYYFGAGVHHPGVISVKSGDRIYIEDGAVVYGSIYGENVSDVKVFGYGILDGSYEERYSYHCYENNTIGCVKFYDSKNITVEGITLRDSAIWIFNAFGCEDVHLDNIKLVGHWRYNTDGIDIVNSSNVTIENCFIRSFDDTITLKGIAYYKDKILSDITVRNCVLWCGWGRTLEIGLETVANEFRNLYFENCDLIHNSSVAIDIQSGDYAHIHDVVFRDIRVEYQAYTQPPLIQQTAEDTYDSHGEKWLPVLIGITSQNYFIGDEKYDALLSNVRCDKKTVIENILYEEIRAYTDSDIKVPLIFEPSEVNCSGVSGIIVKDLFVNGNKLSNRSQTLYRDNGLVKNVKLL